MVDHRNAIVSSMATGYPHKWANILTGPLSQGAEALNPCITDKFVPSPMIVQSLLYFTLQPPSPPLPAHIPTPLSILYKIASLHSTASLMAHNTLPTYPREKLDVPDWLYYEPNGDMEKSIRKRMKGCTKEGIWGLLWESEGRKTGRKKRKRGTESDDESEGEEEEGRRRKVSERGWLVLEWLVHIWENDQDESDDYSPSFLAQLPKQGDMQIDNPTLPLQVLYSVFESFSGDSTEGTGTEPGEEGEIMGFSKEEQCRRERTAGRLAFLLINTANPKSTTKPPFHPSTLTISLLPLFRLPTPKLQKLLNILSSSEYGQRDKATLTHFLVHSMEDTAGVRSSKIIARRAHNEDFINDPSTNFPRPTIKYMFDLLLLPPEKDEEEVERGERMGIMKLVLVATLIQICDTYTQNEDWGEGRKKSWRREFRKVMGDENKRVRRMMLTLLDKRVE